jgi:hypothetical protein
MHVPLSGIVFVPLTALVFLLRPSRLEELLICLAVFQGAAVVNLGGGFTFGLSPYFFTASLLAVRVGLKWTSGRIRFQRGEFAQNHLQIAAFFIAWCVVSAFLLPILFEGTPVDSPRAGAEAVFYLALPLRWSFSNAGQAGYMVLNFLVLLAFTDFCAGRSLEPLMEAFTYSGVIVLLVGFYQMTADRFGLPFPASFFNSNGTWAQNYNQMIGAGWHRVSATFVEPSDAGGFLSCWVSFELILANWGSTKRTRHWIFAILGSVVLLATTSSTGYVTVALVLAFMGGRLTLELLGRGRIPIRTAITAATVVLVGVGFLAISHGASLLDVVLWHKAGSSSAVVRLATVWRAVAVMQETYGLGAGLGSNRAFGMLAYIGSNLGIFGLALFSYMLAHLFVKTFSYLRIPSTSVTGRVAMIACAVTFFANLIGIAISGAEISNPRIWVLWGMLLASVRAQTRAIRPQSDEMPGLSRTDDFLPGSTLRVA